MRIILTFISAIKQIEVNKMGKSGTPLVSDSVTNLNRDLDKLNITDSRTGAMQRFFLQPEAPRFESGCYLRMLFRLILCDFSLSVSQILLKHYFLFIIVSI